MISFYNAIFYISCYYAVISFALRYPAGLDHGTDSFAFALLVAAALLLAIGQTAQARARVLRIIALILPAAALLWNHTMPGILEYTLPWGYLVYLSCRRPRSLSHYYFKSDFSHLLWGFLLILLLILFRPERGIAALSEATPYLIIFLSAGVSLLQVLRHKEEKIKGFVRHQSEQTAVFFLFCILLTAGGILEFFGNILQKKILRPAGLFLINSFFSLIEYIGNKFSVEESSEIKKDLVDYQEYVEKTVEKKPVPPALEAPTPQEPIKHGEMNYMLIAVLVALLAAVVIFIILRKNAKKHVRQAAVFDEREKLPKEAKGRRKWHRRSTPQKLIREYYQKFMRMTDASAHKLKDQDTTREIRGKYMLGKSEEKAAEYAREFTEIYRVARYREDVRDEGEDGAVDLDFDIQRPNMQRRAKRMKILLDYLRKV